MVDAGFTAKQPGYSDKKKQLIYFRTFNIIIMLVWNWGYNRQYTIGLYNVDASGWGLI